MTEMLLIATATAEALDQRNVVFYDELSNDQQKFHVIITVISAYIALFINLHSNGKSRKKMMYVLFLFVGSMMREQKRLAGSLQNTSTSVKRGQA